MTEILENLDVLYRGGDDIDSEYLDSDGRRLTLDQVIDHTVRSDGIGAFGTLDLVREEGAYGDFKGNAGP